MKQIESDNVPSAESVLKTLEQLPSEERMAVVSQISVSQESFSGPLPHPQILKEYDTVLPGAAERILLMAESEQRHRHLQEDRICKGNVVQVKRGQWIAFSVVVLLTVAATLITLFGEPTVGGIIFGSTIAAVAAIFVITKKSNKPSNTEE